MTYTCRRQYTIDSGVKIAVGGFDADRQMGVSVVDEARVHTPQWRRAAHEVRRELDMPEATEVELDHWLRRMGPLRMMGLAAAAFDSLSTADGHYPARYFPYFFACVLSHHRGSTAHHTAPRWILNTDPPLHGLARRLDYYAAWYIPGAEAPEGHTWKPVRPPAAFEVRWPKLDW